MRCCLAETDGVYVLQYFGGAVALDAAIAAEVQRAPESKAGGSTSEGMSLLGKRLSMSDMGSDSGAADKKKAATAEVSSASVFASVVAYTVRVNSPLACQKAASTHAVPLDSLAFEGSGCVP